MKKNIFAYILVGCLLGVSCNKENTNKKNLTLTGKIDGLKQGVIYIQKVQDTAFTTLDSIVFKGNSEFRRELNVDFPEVFYLTLDRGTTNSIDNQISFFAEPGKIHINTSLKNFYADTKITGSKNQEVYENYLKTRRVIFDKQNEILIEILNAERENKITQRDSLITLSKKLEARKYLNAVNFALNHKDTDVAPYIALTELYDRQIKFLDTISNSLTKEISEGYYGKELKKFIEERKEENK